MKQRSALSVSGGNPAGFPDFRPINRLPPRPLPPPRPVLYQVWVEDRRRGPIAVGPKAPLEILDGFAATIRQQILLGKEKDWSNPVVVPYG